MVQQDLSILAARLRAWAAELREQLDPATALSALLSILRMRRAEQLESAPPEESSLRRIAHLPPAERGAALAHHAELFTGPLGAFLRGDQARTALAQAAALSAGETILAGIAALDLHPEHLSDEQVRELERDLYAELSPADENARADLARVYAAHAGATQPAEPIARAARATEISLETDCDSRINWAMERNGVPIVHSVRIHNRGAEALEEVDLRLQISSQLSEPCTRSIARIAPGASFAVEHPDLKLRGERLRAVLERERAALHVDLLQDGRTLIHEELPIEVLAFNEWDGEAAGELLASFVLPNHPVIQEVLALARKTLGEATGDPTLDGYQSRSPGRIRAMVDALYRTLQKLDMTYVNPPASFESSGQKIRLPEQMLRYRMGSCLDIAVLCAACLEQIGLHALIVHVRGHAFPGVWLVDDFWMSTPAADDRQLLLKLIEVDELLLFDSSTVTVRPPLALSEASRRAGEFLADQASFRQVIDIQAARLARIQPVPLARISADLLEPAAEQASAPAAPPDSVNEELLQRARRREDEQEESDTPPAPEPPPQEPRVARWKERLLDLSLRNRLLNYRPARHASIALCCGELGELEDRLAVGRSFALTARIELEREDPRVAELLASRGADELLEERRRELLEHDQLLTELDERELDERLLTIARRARSEIEESGSSTLYLALGMLEWAEREREEVLHRAPILLVPVELQRTSARSRWSLGRSDDETRLNETLLEKLRLEFGLEFPELEELPLDEAGVDVPRVIRVFKEGVARIEHWRVLEEAHLAFFSFAKYLMWRDLDTHMDDLLRNPLVQHLVAGDGAFEAPAFPAPDQLDSELHPRDTHGVLDADSSQLCALEAAARGMSFVLQGPPGTGKSQTIANIIAAMLAADKRVLFVAEKRAALEVVASRLRRAGLGDYCLELHSNKARKREVCLALAATLERRRGEDLQARREKLAVRIAEERAKLNALSARVHERQPLGRSFFAATSELVELRAVDPIAMSFEQILAIDAQAFERHLELLDALARAAAGVPAPAGHPFAACRFNAWTPLRAREVRAALEAAEEAARALDGAGERARQALAIAEELPIAALTILSDLLAHLGAAARPPARLIEREDLPELLPELLAVAGQGVDYQSRRAALFARWDARLLELDLEDLIGAFRRHGGAFFPLRWLLLRGARQQVAQVARAGSPPPLDTLVPDLEEALEVRELGRAIARREELWRTALGARYDGVESSWVAILRDLEWTREWLELLALLAPWLEEAPRRELFLPAPGELAPQLCADLAGALRALAGARERLEGILVVDLAAACGLAPERLGARALADRAALWIENIELLRPWSRFIAAENALLDGPLEPLARALRAGALAPGELEQCYRRTLLEQWLDHLIEAHVELRDFDRAEHESVIERFRRDDLAFLELGREYLCGLLDEHLPRRSSSPAASSEVGIVQREARKKRRHLPIRRLLSEIPNLLPRIKPCVLMSPLSIAQYLPPAREPFDLVIFDEASQIPTHDAIGAIARGRQVIIVGDSKQLPPTTFFNADIEALEERGGEDRVQELESILDECMASQIPAISLRWHYRSRDEALITFSNYHYYGNRLATFPANKRAADTTGVSLRWVGGTYAKGGARTNRAEAEAVAAHVLECLSDRERRARSIGIVTFNLAQQTLIEDLLEKHRREHPEIEPFFGERVPEPVFIKNLENVQGDERDTMLFSICYGPDEDGRISMNFGPLNREGGERRLNVAITRAREQLIVFSSLRPDQIDLARTRAAGAAHLKSFLYYAEHGPRAFAHATELESAVRAIPTIAADIRRCLEERGHQVESEVGCSEFRLDLAVRAPGEAGGYLLGILCDGPFYARAATARDRDRLREQVLVGLGWRILRVWSMDWRLDPGGELARIEEHLGRAARARRRGLDPTRTNEIEIEEKAPGSEPEPEESEEEGSSAPAAAEPPSAAAPAGETYQPLATDPPRGSAEEFFAGRCRSAAAAVLLEVVAAEAPLHLREAARRSAALFGITRLTRRVEERVRDLLECAPLARRIVQRGDFLWKAGEDPTGWERVRVPGPGGELRQAEHLPPEEIAAALLRTLQANIAMPARDLLRQGARALGYTRLGEKLRTAFQAGLELLLERGACHREEDTVRLR